MVEVGRAQRARTIECPGCGLVRDVDQFRRTAGEFCTRCDYPLFFAPVAGERYKVEASDRAEVEHALRRLPGDRHRLVTEPCPACAERNPVGGVTCLRCGALLHPPEALAEPMPTPVPEPVAAPVETRPWLTPTLVAALVAVIVVIALVVVLVRR